MHIEKNAFKHLQHNEPTVSGLIPGKSGMVDKKLFLKRKGKKPLIIRFWHTYSAVSLSHSKQPRLPWARTRLMRDGKSTRLWCIHRHHEVETPMSGRARTRSTAAPTCRKVTKDMLYREVSAWSLDTSEQARLRTERASLDWGKNKVGFLQTASSQRWSTSPVKK